MNTRVYLVKTKYKDMTSRSAALLRLLETLQPFKDYKKDEFIPVKISIGDASCIYNISPKLVRIVIEAIKGRNANPFLFDTNVIYKGSRMNAIDHMTLVQNKGFGHTKVGCPFIVADGLFGQDGKDYSIDSKYIDKKIKIPSFIGMVDNLLILSHATGHILTGYAGAIKNISMGMVSRATKQIEHSSLKPYVIEKDCIACGCCIKICPVNAIYLENEKAHIKQDLCIGCGECLCGCRVNAIFINWSEDKDIFAKRMIDVAYFILSKFKNRFFITFAFDITKECDCISTQDERLIAGDIGILASEDPLAIDKATVDLMNKYSDTPLEEKVNDTYKTMFRYGEKKGLGNLDYALIEI